MRRSLPTYIERWRPAPVHRLSRALGMGMASGTILAGIGLGSAPLFFVDLPSLIITMGGTVGLLLATFGVEGSLQALRTVLAEDATKREIEHGISFFLLGGACSVGMGALGVVIGLVQLLQLSAWDLGTAAPALAVTLLTAFYGLVQAIPCVAATVALARREATGIPAEAAGIGTVISALGTAAVLGPALMSAFFLLFS